MTQYCRILLFFRVNLPEVVPFSQVTCTAFMHVLTDILLSFVHSICYLESYVLLVLYTVLALERSHFLVLALCFLLVCFDLLPMS